jgi:exocyst complex component 4
MNSNLQKFIREELKKVPAVLEQFIGKKYYLRAAELLMKAIEVAHKEELVNVGALSDLRSLLLERKNVSFQPS